MSRFAIDPRWLVYLPPTMSPDGDVAARTLLEHPEEAFAYYRAAGVARGGLRGEAHGLARDRGRLPRRGVARARFGVRRRDRRDLHAHRARPFFDDAANRRPRAAARRRRPRRAVGELATDWLCSTAS